MRRAVVAGAVGCLVAACGLSIEGSAVLSTTPDGAPPVMLPDGATAGDDDDTVTTTPDTGGPVVEPIDAPARPDAQISRPTVACNENDCNGAPVCGVEKCTSGHWATVVGLGMDNTSGACRSRTRGFMEQALSAPADAYWYQFGVVLGQTGSGTFTIGEFLLNGVAILVLRAENNVVKICRPATALLPATCVGDVALGGGGGGTVLGVYGRLSRTQPYGSAILARGTTCTAVDGAVLDLDIPASGAFVARFGCITGEGCDFQWYDARIELQPLP